ncbi:hypothetical protein COCNU_02G001560 [Cocos nucifera]|uniref:Aminotransferase class I/classII large domain-containing protein n=1 Tax=Cocos nucifera TaxID=13894 RepID=A0A8K0HXQ3_COCNU|nr:hypothetical protein COCNU_02G001560 [Cocos nucifera]
MVKTPLTLLAGKPMMKILMMLSAILRESFSWDWQKTKFDRDLRWRTGVNIIPVHCNGSNGFPITVKALQEAYATAVAANIRVIRGLLLTNPSNPLGTAITKCVLEEILDFAAQKDTHLISDEIYSG